MCLIVKSSHVRKPIPVMKVVKKLEWNAVENRWETYYVERVVPTDVGGFFCAKEPANRKSEYKQHSTIEGGYLHSYDTNGFHYYVKVHTELPKDPNDYYFDTFYFEAWAYDVVAIGHHNDVVSKTLYIPAFDLRKKRR